MGVARSGMGVCQTTEHDPPDSAQGEFDAAADDSTHHDDSSAYEQQSTLETHVTPVDRKKQEAQRAEDWETRMGARTEAQRKQQTQPKRNRNRAAEMVERKDRMNEAHQKWKVQSSHGSNLDSVDPAYKQMVQGALKQSSDWALVELDMLLNSSGDFDNQDRQYFNKAWSHCKFTAQIHSRNVTIYTKPALASAMANINLGAIAFNVTRHKVEGMFMGELTKRTAVGVLANLSIHEICAFHDASRKDSLLPRAMVMLEATVDFATRKMLVVLRTDVPFLLEPFKEYLKTSLEGVSW